MEKHDKADFFLCIYHIWTFPKHRGIELFTGKPKWSESGKMVVCWVIYILLSLQKCSKIWRNYNNVLHMLHRACVNFSNLIPWKLCWFRVCSRTNYDFWYVCREKSLQLQFSFDGWGESSTWIQPAGEHRLFHYQWPMGGSLHGLMSRRWELACSEVRKECKQTRKQARTGRRISLNKKFDDERTCLQLWWVVSVIFFLKVPFFTLHLTFSLADLPNPALFPGHVGTTLPCMNNL